MLKIIRTIVLISMLTSCKESTNEQFTEADKGFNIAEDSLQFYFHKFNGDDVAALNNVSKKISYFENAADSCLNIQDSLLKLNDETEFHSK